MYRHRQFSGDPHPGNFLLLADGRVAFLDFGLFKRMPAEAAEFELQIARAWRSRATARPDHAPRTPGRLPRATPERSDPSRCWPVQTT